MSYDAKETSQFEGAPVEYYEWTFGASSWRMTSGDLIHEPWEDAGTYERVPVKRSAQDFSREDDQATIEVRIPITHAVAQLFIAWNPPGAVRLTIRRKHRTDAEVITVFVGDVVSPRYEGAECVLTCAPAGSALSRIIPGTSYQTQCNWSFCDENCGKDPDDVTFDAIITAIDGATLTAVAFSEHGAGFFRAGMITLANGDARTIVANPDDTVTLIAPFRSGDLEVGDTVSARGGCDHTEVACRVHNNIKNHLGFPRIPKRNPFTAGV